MIKSIIFDSKLEDKLRGKLMRAKINMSLKMKEWKNNIKSPEFKQKLKETHHTAVDILRDIIS